MDAFFSKLFTECERGSYHAQWNPTIPGAPGVLYARAKQLARTGFSKVEDHFLFIDCDRSACPSVEQVKEVYKNFSRFASQGFKVPRLLRMTLPNIAIVLVSAKAFPAELVELARNSTLSPMGGGESGQLVLVDLSKKKVTGLASMSFGRHPRTGALPLIQAIEEIRALCKPAF